LESESKNLAAILGHCNDAGMEYVQPHLYRMIERFEGKHGGYDTTRLEADLRELHSRVQDEMERILVMRIPKDRAGYFEQISMEPSLYADAQKYARSTSLFRPSHHQ
jgi:hypothetical protein